MSQEPILLLKMATTPAYPIPERLIAETRARRLTSFNLVSFIQQAAAVLTVSALCWGSYLAVSHYFIKSVKVVGVSMVPTLQANGSYLLNVWALHDRDPMRGEIVVIRDPGDHGLSVKRIVAMPGESVHFKDGMVFVNGQELKENYLLANTRTFTYSKAHEQFITCGKAEFFVLGDNREQSIDSRAYGPVTREGILGLVKVP